MGQQRPVWKWNGDIERPTVTPSILVNSLRPERQCHLYLTNGFIKYLSDCHHDLAGHNIEMLDWED